MAGMEPLDVRSLAVYDEEDRLVGVKEFHVAQALLEGRQEELSQLLPSQWGMVHLFDLCLWFGHADTAWAMAMRGVEGCILEDHHLGPFSRDSPVGYGHFCHCQGLFPKARFHHRDVGDHSIDGKPWSRWMSEIW